VEEQKFIKDVKHRFLSFGEEEGWRGRNYLDGNYKSG
jgi:hypothetical protein